MARARKTVQNRRPQRRPAETLDALVVERNRFRVVEEIEGRLANQQTGGDVVDQQALQRLAVERRGDLVGKATQDFIRVVVGPISQAIDPVLKKLEERRRGHDKDRRDDQQEDKLRAAGEGALS